MGGIDLSYYPPSLKWISHIKITVSACMCVWCVHVRVSASVRVCVLIEVMESECQFLNDSVDLLVNIITRCKAGVSKPLLRTPT